MSGGINLKVLSDWRSSLGVAFQNLRRALFVYEDDFEWLDFNPLPLTASGTMTITAQTVEYARYLKIGKLVFITIRVVAITTATAGAQQIIFNVPFNSPGAGTPTIFAAQNLSARVVDGGASLSGQAILTSNNKMGVLRYDGANWGNGTAREITVSGFYETL